MTRPAENQQTVEELAEAVREAHAKAMEALAADVHPYSGSAVREWEEALDTALRDLVVQAEAAEQLAEQLRLAIEQDYCTTCGRLLADDAYAVPADSREPG